MNYNPAATSAWYDAQEAVIRGDQPASSLLAYLPLLVAHKEACGPTNLSIRHEALSGTVGGRTNALKDLTHLVRLDSIYVEGYSYFRAVQRAFTAAGIQTPIFERVLAAYEALRAPDGTIPLPECREEPEALTEAARWQGIRWIGPYLVARFPGIYFCLNLDDSFLKFRRNLHVKPAYGSYVLWVDGGWWVAPVRYTGFDLAKAAVEAVAYGLPPGFIPVEWRTPAVELEVAFSGLVSAGGGVRPTHADVTMTYRKGRRLFGLLPGRKDTRQVILENDEITIRDNGREQGRAIWNYRNVNGRGLEPVISMAQGSFSVKVK